MRDAGDGDLCPLVPEHGRMFTVPSAVPKQYCPNVQHDGRGETPPSRNIWPYHGFEESVIAHKARFASAPLPDLSTLEVH